MEIKELEDLAAEWWHRCYGNEVRGDFTIHLPRGATMDIRQVLADFAHQLPAQEESGLLPKADKQRLVQIARALMEHDPYRKAFEDHMAVCNRPIVINMEREK